MTNVVADKTDLQAFVTRLEAIKKASFDEIAKPTTFGAALYDRTEGDATTKMCVLSREGKGIAKPNDWAHRQIADKLAIPQRYYERMTQSAPKLWEDSVNRWLQDEAHRSYLLRFVDLQDGKLPVLRAFLSDRFRILDHLDILWAALDTLKALKGVKVEKLTLTDRYMYLAFVHENMTVNLGTAEKPDVYKAGLIGANSETGGGMMYWKPRIWRQVCSNGAVMDLGVEQVHLGRKLTEEFLFSDETKRLENKLIFEKVKDTIKSVFDETKFRALAEMLKSARDEKLEQPTSMIEALVKVEGYSDDQKKHLLDAFANEGNSRLSLVNAVTSLVHIEKDDDKKVAYEVLGGQILSREKVKA